MKEITGKEMYRITKQKGDFSVERCSGSGTGKMGKNKKASNPDPFNKDKAGKDKKDFNPDPFNKVSDRSVERVRLILARKKPDAICSNQPNPTTMARLILEDLKVSQLKALLKANWRLVKARDRLRGIPSTKQPMLDLLIPLLAKIIEMDR